MRIRAFGFTDVFTERTLNLGSETHREDVFRDNTYIGQVIYLRRARDWGWVPAKTPRNKLTTKGEAIRRLPQFSTEQTVDPNQQVRSLAALRPSAPSGFYMVEEHLGDGIGGDG